MVFTAKRVWLSIWTTGLLACLCVELVRSGMPLWAKAICIVLICVRSAFGDYLVQTSQELLDLKTKRHQAALDALNYELTSFRQSYWQLCKVRELEERLGSAAQVAAHAPIVWLEGHVGPPAAQQEALLATPPPIKPMQGQSVSAAGTWNMGPAPKEALEWMQKNGMSKDSGVGCGPVFPRSENDETA